MLIESHAIIIIGEIVCFADLTLAVRFVVPSNFHILQLKINTSFFILSSAHGLLIKNRTLFHILSESSFWLYCFISKLYNVNDNKYFH